MNRKKGFGRVATMSGYKREDLKTPAFLRKEKTESMNIVKMGMIDDNDNPDLEIPTFLRRQAD
jgi:cell division protein FtsZ